MLKHPTIVYLPVQQFLLSFVFLFFFTFYFSVYLHFKCISAKLFFQRIFCSQQNWMKSLDGSHVLLGLSQHQHSAQWCSFHSQPTLPCHHHQSSQFTSGFAFGGVRSMGFEEYLMPCIYYCGIIENTVTVLKILCAVLMHPSLPTPLNPGNQYCLHNFAFSRTSYSWNHIVCSLFRLFLSLSTQVANTRPVG